MIYSRGLQVILIHGTVVTCLKFAEPIMTKQYF